MPEAKFIGTDEVSPTIEKIVHQMDRLETKTVRATTNLGRGLGQGVQAFMRLEVAAASLTSSQIRQEMAQDRLRQAVERYGVGSQEAINAQRNLEITTNLAAAAQVRMWVYQAYTAFTLAPRVVSAFHSITTAVHAHTAATNLLNKALILRNSLMHLGIGLALTAATVIGAEALASYSTGQPMFGGVFGGGGGGGTTGGVTNVYGNVNVRASNMSEFQKDLDDQTKGQLSRARR